MGMLDQTNGKEIGAAILPVVGMVESEEQREGGVEKLGGFFNEYGAPVPGARVEKPPGFFTTNPAPRGPQLGEKPPRFFTTPTS